jgi:hypothetical protein
MTADDAENVRRAVAALSQCTHPETGATLASIFGVDLDRLAAMTMTPSRITPRHLEALDEAHFATAQGLTLRGDLRVALWELHQLLRADAGVSPTGTDKG